MHCACFGRKETGRLLQYHQGGAVYLSLGGGIALPFVSYGGTALISFMGFMGIVLNVSRSVEK